MAKNGKINFMGVLFKEVWQEIRKIKMKRWVKLCKPKPNLA